jgi:hypothetical protein
MLKVGAFGSLGLLMFEGEHINDWALSKTEKDIEGAPLLGVMFNDPDTLNCVNEKSYSVFTFP